MSLDREELKRHWEPFLEWIRATHEGVDVGITSQEAFTAGRESLLAELEAAEARFDTEHRRAIDLYDERDRIGIERYQLQAERDRLRNAIKSAAAHIRTLPKGALGYDDSPDGGWPYRDEMLHHFEKVLEGTD